MGVTKSSQNMKHLVASAALLAGLGQTASWSYDDQANWPQAHCGGKRQSPIDIVTKSAEPVRQDPLFPDGKSAADFVTNAFKGSHKARFADVRSDSVHAIKYSFADEITYGDLRCPQFHYHFDSEHEIDGRLFFGEYH